ncbi:MAG: hypothetical protein SGJ27_29585 [Candidatus Melainabacteria bacterium]|nr:hypothetical protein [Candidatus Melainabacteria bacterium]
MMVSNPESLSPSREKPLDPQKPYQPPNFSSEVFAPDSRLAGPTDKEKDLSDSASRSPNEKWTEELLSTPLPSTNISDTERSASAQLLEKLGLPMLEIFGASPEQLAKSKQGTPLVLARADAQSDSKTTGENPIKGETDKAPTTEQTPKLVNPESITYPGGKQRLLTWDGDTLSANTGLDGKKWDRVKVDGKYTDAWRDPAGAIWKGTIEVDRSTNDVSRVPSGWPKSVGEKTIFRASGDKETIGADNTRSIHFTNNERVTYNKDNLLTSFKGADGITRNFSDFKSVGASKEMSPTKIEVVTTATDTAPSTVTKWTMDDKQKWTCEGAPGENSAFHIDSENGTYAIENFVTGINKKFAPGKYVEVSEWEGGASYRKRDNVDGTKTVLSADEKWSVTLSDDLSTRFETEGKVRDIKRDDKGSVTSLQDISSNREWTKDDTGEWNAKPIDEAKPYTPPAVPTFKGEVSVDARGLAVVKGAGPSFKVLDMDGTLKTPSPSENLRALALTSTRFSRPGQARFAESVNNFMERPGLSAEQKNNSVHQITRLMANTTGGPFSIADKQTLAAQLSWHMARPNRQEQGQNKTCNVTTIRASLISESPADFAKMIADVGTTGQFVTADGSTIIPTVQGMNLNKAATKFPPESGSRSWLGQVSDHTMANIHWQRETVDTFGYAVNKGELKYVQNPGTGDSGERIERWQNDRMWYQLKNSSDQYIATSPAIGAGQLADIYGQITGRDESERVIAANLVPTLIAEGEQGIKVNNEGEFESQMNKGPWPKIIVVHSSRDPFWSDSGSGTAGGAGGRDGGWHVVVAQSYDATTRKVNVDNSWQPSVDHVIPTRRLPIKQLYESTLGPVR